MEYYILLSLIIIFVAILSYSYSLGFEKGRENRDLEIAFNQFEQNKRCEQAIDANIRQTRHMVARSDGYEVFTTIDN